MISIRRTARYRFNIERPWLVVVGMADRSLDVQNPMIRVVHRDQRDRAVEVMRNQGYGAVIKMFAAKTNIAAREWAERIEEQRDAVLRGETRQPLRTGLKPVVRIDHEVLAERVAPADDPFGYFNGHYSTSPRPSSVACV